MDTLEMILEFNIGQDGRASGPGCFFRAFDRLARFGKPIGRLSYLALRHEGRYFNLGIVCLSPAGHLLMFPGIGAKTFLGLAVKGRPEAGDLFVVDHLTLVKDLKSWHFTTTDDSHSSTKCPTVQIGESALHWFALELRSADVLEPTYRVNSIQVPIPRTDAWRRIACLNEAHRDSARTVINTDASGDGETLRFDFVLGNPENGKRPHPGSFLGTSWGRMLWTVVDIPAFPRKLLVALSRSREPLAAPSRIGALARQGPVLGSYSPLPIPPRRPV